HLRRRCLPRSKNCGESVSARQRGGYRNRRERPSGRILLQAVKNYALNRHIQVRRSFSRRPWDPSKMLLFALRRTSALKWPRPCVQLEQHQTKRVEVGPRRRGIASELLWGHVRRSSHLFPRVFFHVRCQTKVRYARLATAIDQNIGRLEVAVHNLPCVRRSQPSANLLANLVRL